MYPFRNDCFIKTFFSGPNGISNDICLVRVPSIQENRPPSCHLGECYDAICLPDSEPVHGQACHLAGFDDQGSWPDLQTGGEGSYLLGSVSFIFSVKSISRITPFLS